MVFYGVVEVDAMCGEGSRNCDGTVDDFWGFSSIMGNENIDILTSSMRSTIWISLEILGFLVPHHFDYFLLPGL